jgi:hypothetical protein
MHIPLQARLCTYLLFDDVRAASVIPCIEMEWREEGGRSEVTALPL